MNEREEILQTAIHLTMGDRNENYGDPVDEYQRQAAAFHLLTGHDITAREAVLFMVLLKLGRLSGNEMHKDSYIDAAAYLAIAWECAVAENAERVEEMV